MPIEQDELDRFLASVDKIGFNSTGFVQEVIKPWGYEIHFTPPDLPYMGKILHVLAKRRLSLQAHDQKTETWWLLNGRVMMVIEDNTGKLREMEMQKGLGYTTQIGQRHRLVGIEDSDILEVSTPEIGRTYRLDDDYNRETETEEMREQPNRGWNLTE